MAKTVLAPFLSVVFNKCMVKGVYPNSLKVAQVIPVHKKGDESACTNYRPISLLSQFNKIFERILHHRLYSYLQDFELLTGHQFGFRPNSSTSLAVERIYSDLLHNYDNGLFTCSLFIDLSKAFDTVNHNILIKKLHQNYGLNWIALQLFTSYLTKRKQYTVVNGAKSNCRNIACGIPQGSTLGPLLFIIYINDLPLCSKFKTILYADDTYLSLSHSSLSTLQSMVNNELLKVHEWMSLNKLSINYAKWMYLQTGKKIQSNSAEDFLVTLGNHQIKREQSVKYLGVIVDEKLNWSSHLKQLETKLAFASSVIYKTRNILPLNTLKLLYYSFAYTHLSYCVTALGSATTSHLKPIYVKQNNILRNMTFSNYNPQVSQFIRDWIFWKRRIYINWNWPN